MIAKRWRDAATLMIAVRSPGNSYKILMLKRSSKSKFMPNAYVFPGGVKSEADFSCHWNSLFSGSTRNHLVYSSIFSTKQKSKSAAYHESEGIHPGIGYRICALRETFEESGLLITTDPNGKKVILSNPNLYVGGEYTTLNEWRKYVHNDATNFFKLFQNLQLSPGVDKLREWSTWLTPTFEQYRYNTMFYISCIDDASVLNEEQHHCEEEMTDTKWISTEHALEHLQNSLYPPQVVEILRLNKHKTFTALNDFTTNREREGLSVWCPNMIKAKDGIIICYPGDALHNTDVNAETADLHDQKTIRELNNDSGILNRMERYHNGTRRLLQNIGWHGHEALGFLDLKDHKSNV